MSGEDEPDEKLESEQNLLQKEEKTNKRENQKRRQQIMRLLFCYEAMAVSDITEMCELDEKGKDKYSHIWRPLKNLKDRRYIEKKIHSGAKDPFKGMGPVYSIKRDFRVLLAIYQDPEFVSLQAEMRDSDWISAFIYEQRFHKSEKISEKDLLTMLKISKVFFEICLQYEISSHLILILKPLFLQPIIRSRETGLFDPVLSEYYLSNAAVYDLFVYCMFKENLDKMLLHDLSDKNQEFLNKMLVKRERYSNEITNYLTSITVSELVAGIVDASRKNNNQIPEHLLTNLAAYQDAVEKTRGEGFFNPRLRVKPGEILMSLREDLGVSPEKGRRSPT
jgi:hypothetical protein